MPYEIGWYVERRIVRARVYGEFGLSEIRSASEQAAALFEQGTPPVHIVVDVAAMKLVASSIQAIQGEATSYLKHPRLGWWVIYGNDNPMLLFLGRTVARLSGARFRMMPTLGHALYFLQLQDPTLGDLPGAWTPG